MAVTEILKGIGSWSLTLSENTPEEILQKIRNSYFGHIAISPGKVDPRVSGDAILSTARYVGVYRGKGKPAQGHNLRGAGMAFWLGDEEGKGDVIEDTLALNAVSFSDGVTNLLPPSGSLQLGTVYSVPGAFSHTFKFISRREAYDYFTDTMGAEYRVRNDGYIDAGLESDLYRTDPVAAVVRNASGRDMMIRLLQGDLQTDQDMEDYTTRVLLIASGSGDAISTATADINPALNPFKDLHGNTLKLTRMIAESTTDTSNAEARAQLQLNRFSSSRDAISLSTNEYDVTGDASVGDYIWVFDREAGVFNDTNEVWFRGRQIYPIKLRLTGATWPVSSGMGVSFRTNTGEWINLNDYYVPELGATTLEVGGYRRSLVGGSAGPGGDRGQPDTSIPNPPTWVEPFRQSVYQSLTTGDTQSQVELEWLKPTNTDGSIIVDGHHYEIRYRSGSAPILPVTLAQLSVFTQTELVASGATLADPLQYDPGEWQYQIVPFDKLTSMLIDLRPSSQYEAQVRAVDSATPPNVGAWSSLAVWQTSRDNIPPATPAPPTIAANPISIQMTHTLGRADGGEYNLDRDLQYLEVHGESEPLFTPSPASLIGKVLADQGMLIGETPVVESFNMSRLPPQYYKVVAVDWSGNKSAASSPVEQTAELISDQYISNLTVSKVTAGTITSNWIIAAEIATANSGARAKMSFEGFGAWNSTGTKTFDVSAATGNVAIIGSLKSGTAGTRIEINPTLGTPTIDLYPNALGGRVRLAAYDNNNPDGSAGAGMRLQSEIASNGERHGGFLTFTEDGVFLGNDYTVASTYAYYWIDAQGRHTLRGRWLTSQFDAYSALLANTSPSFPSGTLSGSISWGITMISRVDPVANIIDTETVGANIKIAMAILDSATNTTHFGWGAVRDMAGATFPAPTASGKIRYWGFRTG